MKLGRLLGDGFRHLVGIRHLPTHLWTTQERDLRKASLLLPFGVTTEKNKLTIHQASYDSLILVLSRYPDGTSC